MLTGKRNKGIVFGLASGLSWAFYTVFVYNILNLFNTAEGEVGTFRGIMLIVGTAVLIALIDCCFALVFELGYLAKKGKLAEFIKILFSRDSVGILPAALFSGLLGAVPYAIASSFSTSVAGTISAVFPAIGAIVAVIWFKEKLTVLKFSGIIICIIGTALLYGLAGFGVPFWVYLVALLCAVGYALEGCFGYNMLRQEFDSSITTTLRRVYLIAVFIVVVIVITLTTDTWSYLGQLVAGFDVGNTSFAFLEPLVGNKIFIWAIYILGSWCGGISYITWYYSFEYSGVATAQVLNITYGLWIVVLLALPPFSQIPTIGVIIGALVIFIGAAIVVKSDVGSAGDADSAEGTAELPPS
jgi:drug/metabolite transporter (DMT)-like permease